MGIQYIIVPDRIGPAPFVNESQAPSPRLLAALDAQLDLTQVEINRSMRIYRNVAWGPARAQLPADATIPSGGNAPGDHVLPAVTNAPVALPSTDGYANYSGDLPQPSTVYLASGTTGWQLQVNGTTVDRRDALGWSNAFSAGSGHATMQFSTPVTRPLALAGEIALWVLGIFYILRTRVARDERRRLGSEDAEETTSVLPVITIPPDEPEVVDEDDGKRRKKKEKRRDRKRDLESLDVLA